MSTLETSDFQLSRVYGQGWNAAKKLLADGRRRSESQSAKLNPYRGDEERARWAKGFDEGLASRTGSHNATHGRGWHPGSKSPR